MPTQVTKLWHNYFELKAIEKRCSMDSSLSFFLVKIMA
jgi:hypothetical protein